MGGFRIGSDEDHVELPRAIIGGLKRTAVEDLLRRIADDYSQLELEKTSLLDVIAQLETVTGDEAEALGTPVEGSAEGFQMRTAPHEGSDELAATVLALAHRAAREMRESARSECELMIKKTRAHARTLERELERRRATAQAEVDELVRFSVELREDMRASLETLLRTFLIEEQEEQRALERAPSSGWSHAGRT